MLFTDISSERGIRALKKAGFRVSKTQGTKHTVLTDGIHRVVIPRHSRLNPYTLKDIIRDAGLTDRDFKKLL